MSHNKGRRMNKIRIRHLALLISLQCLALGVSSGQAWGDDYFNPALLDDGEHSQERPDLSLYEKGPGLSPGKYKVDILVNNQKIASRDVDFFLANDASGNAILAPCLSISALKSFAPRSTLFPLPTLPLSLTASNFCSVFRKAQWSRRRAMPSPRTSLMRE